jgi:hypothetical protein
LDENGFPRLLKVICRSIADLKPSCWSKGRIRRVWREFVKIHIL